MELKGSSYKPQIIPEDRIAGFRISLNCHKTKTFKEKIQYMINDYHVFNFVVFAEIVPV